MISYGDWDSLSPWVIIRKSVQEINDRYSSLTRTRHKLFESWSMSVDQIIGGPKLKDYQGNLKSLIAFTFLDYEQQFIRCLHTVDYWSRTRALNIPCCTIHRILECS